MFWLLEELVNGLLCTKALRKECYIPIGVDNLSNGWLKIKNLLAVDQTETEHIRSSEVRMKFAKIDRLKFLIAFSQNSIIYEKVFNAAYFPHK